jgi:hypothetical protein
LHALYGYKNKKSKKKYKEKTLTSSNFNKGEALMEIAIIDAGKHTQYTWYQFKDLNELQNWCQNNIINENVLAAIMKPITSKRLKNKEE